jgi:hypothetical protein
MRTTGAVLWEMLAGRPLFDGNDTASIIEQIPTASFVRITCPKRS